MKLDFNETNILVQALSELEKNPKLTITKTKLIETLFALGVHTDKRYTILKISIKSLIGKIELLSDDNISQILADNRNNNIVASVCYELPKSVASQQGV